MIRCYKSSETETIEDVEKGLDLLDEFVAGGTGSAMPLVSETIKKIWNNGDRLQFEFAEELRQDEESRENDKRMSSEKEEAYLKNVELWKNEVVRPIRNGLMSKWIDSIRDHGALWEEQPEEIKKELLKKREELKNWPSVLTEYTEDPQLPKKPSYITE